MFADYLTTYRIIKAKALIGNTDDGFYETGIRAVYPKATYFNSLFKKRTSSHLPSTKCIGPGGAGNKNNLGTICKSSVLRSTKPVPPPELHSAR